MKLGCIADDFSGATDLCGLLARVGQRTRLITGASCASAADMDFSDIDIDVAVVALKSRSAPVEEAVADSLAALQMLRRSGARQYYLKYCSTFDSTPRGNIGPVLDALLDAIGITTTIVCPAYPEQGRTIYRGHLFVGNSLLAESTMAHHPRNPMGHSSLLELLRPQTCRRIGMLPYDVVERGIVPIREELQRLTSEGCAYVVADALEERHLAHIARAASHLPLLSGAAGLGAELAARLCGGGSEVRSGGGADVPAGPTAVLVGSSSVATRAQIARVEGRVPSLKIDPVAIHRGETSVDEISDWASTHLDGAGVVISGSAPPDRVRAVHEEIGEVLASQILESALASVARRLVDSGIRRLVVAGGETSAAVVQALGIGSLEICDELAPGVPWMRTTAEPTIMLALKSGNFGSDSLFERAMGLVA